MTIRPIVNEARHFSPGLQTAPETFVAGMLDSPLLRGKDDLALTRLAQYKVLEKRRGDEATAMAQRWRQ